MLNSVGCIILCPKSGLVWCVLLGCLLWIVVCCLVVVYLRGFVVYGLKLRLPCDYLWVLLFVGFPRLVRCDLVDVGLFVNVADFELLGVCCMVVCFPLFCLV